MSSDSERAASAETYQEKALRKFKQQPLVPLGAAATTFALIMAGSKLRKRESKGMNYWLRARVIAQGLTIAAVVVGSWMMGQTKLQLDQAAAAAAAGGDEVSGRDKRKAEFEERLKGAEESHRLEMAAAVGRGPLAQGQAAGGEPSEASSSEAKEGGKYWPGWGRAVWLGGSTVKTPSSTPASADSASDDKKV